MITQIYHTLPRDVLTRSTSESTVVRDHSGGTVLLAAGLFHTIFQGHTTFPKLGKPGELHGIPDKPQSLPGKSIGLSV